MKSFDNRAGRTTTERELDISDTTYAVSSTTARLGRQPVTKTTQAAMMQRLMQESPARTQPAVASVEQLARCDTTRGLTRYRPESSVRHRSH